MFKMTPKAPSLWQHSWAQLCPTTLHWNSKWFQPKRGHEHKASQSSKTVKIFQARSAILEPLGFTVIAPKSFGLWMKERSLRLAIETSGDVLHMSRMLSSETLTGFKIFKRPSKSCTTREHPTDILRPGIRLQTTWMYRLLLRFLDDLTNLTLDSCYWLCICRMTWYDCLNHPGASLSCNGRSLSSTSSSHIKSKKVHIGNTSRKWPLLSWTPSGTHPSYCTCIM